jgi:hypothetical protein
MVFKKKKKKQGIATDLEERDDGAGAEGVGGLEHVALVRHHHLLMLMDG